MNGFLVRGFTFLSISDLILRFVGFVGRLGNGFKGKNNMRFFSLEDSKKLVEMGCQSDSDIYCQTPIWALHDGYSEYQVCWKVPFPQLKVINSYPVFTPYDFLGDSEQARRNCEILWGKATWYTVEGMTQDSCERITNHGLVWENRRKEMLSSPDHIEFVRGFLK